MMEIPVKKIAAAASLALLAPACAASAETPQGIGSGDVLLRVRVIGVIPSDKSGSVLPALPGEHVSVSNSVMPEVDLTYMASDNIGFELIAATTRHHVSGKTGTTGAIGRLLSSWVLPPTLTAQYHFNPKGVIRPYVGAGLNYTVFWNEKSSKALRTAVGPTAVHLSDSFGWAVQAGIDVDISPKVFANLDVKYIDMDTTARLRTTAAGTQRVRVHVDPLVIGVGLGFRL